MWSIDATLNTAKKMLGGDMPSHVEYEIRLAYKRVEKAGGTLVSRQALACIIAIAELKYETNFKEE